MTDVTRGVPLIVLEETDGFGLGSMAVEAQDQRPQTGGALMGSPVSVQSPVTHSPSTHSTGCGFAAA